MCMYAMCAVLILLLLPHAAGSLKESICSLQSPLSLHYYQEGDVIIGGIITIMGSMIKMKFNFHSRPSEYFSDCRIVKLRTYQNLLAFVFAITEINKNPYLLPNISLGFQVTDPCFSERKALLGMFDILSGTEAFILNYRCGYLPSLVGYVDGISSKVSLLLAWVFGVYNIPQISYSSMDSVFSNKLQFPSFYRTVPNDNLQFKAIIKLITFFGWSWIGLLVPDNESGLKASQVLQTELEQHKSCVAFLEFIPYHDALEERRQKRIVDTLRSTSANVIIVYGDKDYMFTLQITLYNFPIPDKVWLISSQWEVSNEFEHNFLNFNSFNGSLSFVLHTNTIPNLADFILNVQPHLYPNDIFIEQAWQEIFDCMLRGIPSSLELCTGNETLKHSQHEHMYKEISVYSYTIYNAVYGLAHSLHNMRTNVKLEHSDNYDMRAWKIHKYLKTVLFTDSAGAVVQFDEYGDIHSEFDILNWIVYPNQTLHSIIIGQYNPRSSDQLMINETVIRWSPTFNQTPHSACSEICLPGYRKSPRESHSSCCYDCVPCSDGEISNNTDMETCFKCSRNEWPNAEKIICMPKIVIYLSYEEPLGKSLALVSIILFVINCLVMITFIKYQNTPVVKANNQDLSYILLISLKLCFLCTLIFIGHPVEVTCLLRQTIFGVIFSIAVSSILAKTTIVIIAFNATKPESKLNHWVGSNLFNYIVLVCTVFQIVICSVWLGTFPPFPYYNMEDEVGKILAECNEGSIVGLYCVLGYMGLLAIVSFIIAFLARKLPDLFNEATFISFSMLVFCSVWVSFIPAYLSSKGKYVVAVEIFAILASSSGLLGFIFVPKCYIILFKSEMNTKAYVIRHHMTTYRQM